MADGQLRQHLEYIHLQILSVVSSTQLQKVFQRRSNFDLSRLLDGKHLCNLTGVRWQTDITGTEPFLHNLVKRSQYDFTYLTSTLQPLRLAPACRDTAAAALMPPSKFSVSPYVCLYWKQADQQDLLYVLLIAGGHIVTLLRPRKHSIHPSGKYLVIRFPLPVC